MKKTINAKIVADSISPLGDRITTLLLTYPRFIHPELMTHRVFSRNSASSRAIPFEKMIKMVEEDPFIPIAWQKDHKGMQGNEYWNINDQLTGEPGVYYYSPFGVAQSDWLQARDNMVKIAKHMNSSAKITKQICNRLLEPFMWHTVLVTATEWNNFFELRCPKYTENDGRGNKGNIYKSVKDYKKAWGYVVNHHTQLDWLKKSDSGAEIHIQALAESMWDVMNESTPKKLQPGEWHLPFGDKINGSKLINLAHTKITKNKPEYSPNKDEIQNIITNFELSIATARCARLSYMTFNNEIDYEKDIQLHDKLLLDKHMSPFEHCAKVMSNDEYDHFYKGLLVNREFEVEGYNENYLIGSSNDEDYGWCNNFKGFIPYRYIIENHINI